MKLVAAAAISCVMCYTAMTTFTLPLTNPFVLITFTGLFGVVTLFFYEVFSD
jgi:hypothetical protein